MENNEPSSIIYKEIKPKGKLLTFVKSFWLFENNKNEPLNYSILPDGCFDLIIYFTENNKMEINLTGLWNKKVEVSIPAKTKILAIRFKPISAEYIVGKNIINLLNSMVVISSKDYNFLDQLNTHFQDFNSFVESNTLKLLSIIATNKIIDARKVKVFELLFKYNGVISIKELSERVHWSNRQISRYFGKNYGLSIKKYANILRVNATYNDLAKGLHHTKTDFENEEEITYLKNDLKFELGEK